MIPTRNYYKSYLEQPEDHHHGMYVASKTHKLYLLS